MTSNSRTRDWRMAKVGVLLGVIWFAAGWAGDEMGTGIFGLVLLPGFGVALALAGPRESAVLLRGDGDERQRRIQDDAANLTLAILAPLLVAGAVWELAQGYFGKFSVVCSVMGATLMISTVALGRRR